MAAKKAVKAETGKPEIETLVERLNNEASCGDRKVESRAKDLLTIISHFSK